MPTTARPLLVPASRVRPDAYASSRAISRRSTSPSTAFWCGGRSRCSSRAAASASPICFAGSATLRWRSHAAVPRWWAWTAAPSCWRVPTRMPRATDWRTACSSWPPICSKARRRLLAQLGRFDHMLIDPPRDGAQALVHALDAGRTGADRLRVLQSRHAGARCRHPGARQGLPAVRGGSSEHVSPHFPRRVDRPFRPAEIETGLPWQPRSRSQRRGASRDCRRRPAAG